MIPRLPTLRPSTILKRLLFSTASPQRTILTPSVGVTLDLSPSSIRSDLPLAALTIHSALMEHGVCFLRSPSPSSPSSDEDQLYIALAEELGTLEGPHPKFSPDPNSPLAVVAHDAENLPDGAEWHTDCSWSSNPPFASVLWPKQLPPSGGDTLWLSTSAAFKALPEGLKSYLRELSAVHDMGSFRNVYARTEGAEGILKGHQQFGCSIWPIVTTHPVTDLECLFVNETFTVQVDGLMADDSRRLLAYLFGHLNRPDFQCRWKWQLGDVAIWDNRLTQHYACADYKGHSRRMHRVTVLNDRIGG